MHLDQKYLAGNRSTRRDFAGLEERRREGMRLLGQGYAQSEVARKLGVSEVSVSRWKRAYTTRGEQAWRRGRLGKPPKVAEHHLVVIRQVLEAGARVYGYADDRWTYPRIAAVLETLTGLRIHPDHLCRVFHREGLGGPARSEAVAKAKESEDVTMEPRSASGRGMLSLVSRQ